MESENTDTTMVDPVSNINPGTAMASHVYANTKFETMKNMLKSKNAKIATNANFYPIGMKILNY
jgi:hypothetical protein